MTDVIVSAAPHPKPQYDLAFNRATATRKARVAAALRPGPNAYALHATGDCLVPHFVDGDMLVCDPDQVAGPGDFIVLWWKNGAAQPLIKRLVMMFPSAHGPFGPTVIFEQLNPSRVYSVPLEHVAAVHRVIGKAEGGDA